ncbi:MAG TPA: helix-turn-helix domain-containing protein [Rhizomicrobium sp.]|nr:helix-turn-helix domain-containing protein [Rhizomicrobium sp.]
MKKSTGRRLTAQDYRALAQFRHALRQFLAFSEEAAAKAGLTPAQHQALLAIKGMPGTGRGNERANERASERVSVGDLAQWLGVRHHSCVGLVERLAALGLIAKRPDPEDGRRVFLVLTALAERKLAALSAVHRDELRRRAGALGLLLAAIRQ